MISIAFYAKNEPNEFVRYNTIVVTTSLNLQVGWNVGISTLAESVRYRY